MMLMLRLTKRSSGSSENEMKMEMKDSKGDVG